MKGKQQAFSLGCACLAMATGERIQKGTGLSMGTCQLNRRAKEDELKPQYQMQWQMRKGREEKVKKGRRFWKYLSRKKDWGI